MFNLAVLTVSTSGHQGNREDTSGQAIKDALCPQGYKAVRYEIVPDDRQAIAGRLSEWADDPEVDLIVSTGGTGLGPRDVTPEATRDVIEFEVPGIAEAMRMETLRVTPLSMLSRSAAGVRAGCLIINLPGSPKAVRETLEVAIEAIPHGLEMLQGRRGHPPH